jgi:dTMP kinase
MPRGKLIVLEGIDGSGKSTQFKRLTRRLSDEGLPFLRVTFPRYDEPSSALVKMYLSGDFGDSPDSVNAYAASTFFAVDRFASWRTTWGEYLGSGGVVLTDRYTTSNAIHQGAKLPHGEREAFFDWLYDFEFRLMGLPSPDTVLYFDIDPTLAAERIVKRDEARDIHERDFDYLRECAVCGDMAAAHFDWLTADASRRENELHGEVYDIVRGAMVR